MRANALFFAFFVASSVAAAEPASVVVRHHGTLMTGSDQPVTGTVPLTFKIYADPVDHPTTPKPPRWSESYSVEFTSQGHYAVSLGATSGGKKALTVDAFPAGEEIWLGVTVGNGGELSPRLQITSVVHSLDAAHLAGMPASHYATAQSVSEEAAARTAAINAEKEARLAAFAAEAQSRTREIAAEATARISALATELSERTAAIQAEASSRTDADAALGARIDGVERDFLKSSVAASTYLAKGDAASAYLAKTDATSTYLAKTDATSTYLAKTDATTAYLAKTDAATSYLTKTDAASTYATKAALTAAQKNWCYVCNPGPNNGASHPTTTSTSWSDIPGFADCEIATTGGAVSFNAEYSIYITNNHAGMRLIMDPGPSQVIFGANDTYGLDWQSHMPGTWIKRSMTRVFRSVPAGTHKFRLQWRANNAGDVTYLHNGVCTESSLYSGAHMFMQELK